MRPNGTPMPGGEIMDRLSKWYRARAKDGAAVKINPPVELRLPGTSEGRIPTEYNYVLFPPTKESSSASQNTTENTVSPDDNANQKEVQRDDHGSEKGMILENNQRDTREDTRRDAREDAQRDTRENNPRDTRRDTRRDARVEILRDTREDTRRDAREDALHEYQTTVIVE